jgi:hypothetical protein
MRSTSDFDHIISHWPHASTGFYVIATLVALFYTGCRGQSFHSLHAGAHDPHGIRAPQFRVTHTHIFCVHVIYCHLQHASGASENPFALHHHALYSTMECGHFCFVSPLFEGFLPIPVADSEI